MKTNIDELQLSVMGETSSDLAQELNELIQSGGKKFRPGLLFLIGKLLGIKVSDLTTYARSVELTHLASLVHDDVIDESNTRRNYPTLNSMRNNTTAILAGDFLLASVMGELAQLNNNEILIDLTIAIRDLADGEWLQFDLKKKTNVRIEDLEQVSIKKTGSLIRWCCTTPAKLAAHPDIQTFSILGERIGLIFQMADDIVDGMHTSGKPAFQDLLNGQINFVTLKLIELHPELYSAVYALKSNPKNPVPWTYEQYHKAILEVDKVINFEKDKVLSIFSKLCKENKQPDLMPIFEMMINKIQSNYSAALS
ncbi:MAG TPA: polyprenyl synthetase family protein [Bacteriovoracaceae bacterium]|nr:polyprenyl synthetase family protein [Bacteriovoracaceae bacterium]